MSRHPYAIDRIGDLGSVVRLTNRRRSKKPVSLSGLADLRLTDEHRQGDVLYGMVGYPSKIFYEHIAKFIEIFTREGDLVLDPMCGSGSTAIAALLKKRKCIAFDGSSAAAFIAKNYILPLNHGRLAEEFEKIKHKIAHRINSLYLVTCSCGCGRKGFAESTITSNVYKCLNCRKEIVLHGSGTGKRSTYKCSSCGFELNIAKDRHKRTLVERRRPVEVTYICPDCICGKTRHKKQVTKKDVRGWETILQENEHLLESLWYPKTRIVHLRCYPRNGGWPGFAKNSPVYTLFTKRNLIALALLRQSIQEVRHKDIREILKLCLIASLFRSSRRIFSTSGLKNVYHVPPLGKEQNVWSVFERKFHVLAKAKARLADLTDPQRIPGMVRVFKHDAHHIPLPDDSVDYVFVDPPYGGMVPYYELNLFLSAWLRENEDFEREVIIPMDSEKNPKFVAKWGKEIEATFAEMARVLKPGSYLTVAFQSKFDTLWNEFRDIMNNRLSLHFVEITSNVRGTTFHKNLQNDTNPKSAFITYRKPTRKSRPICLRSEKQLNEIIMAYLRERLVNSPEQEFAFRAIQSEIIELAHREQFSHIPSDHDLRRLLIECGFRETEDGRWVSMSQ